LETLYKNETTRLVSGLKHRDYLRCSSRVETLETVYNLIETLDLQARAIDEHRSTAANDNANRTAVQRALAFSGSAYWNTVSGYPE
jgi:hypothetical protein